LVRSEAGEVSCRWRRGAPVDARAPPAAAGPPGRTDAGAHARRRPAEIGSWW